MPSRLYSSSDAGAPRTSNGVALLYRVLITGYGSRPPAGWELVDIDSPSNPTVMVARQGSDPAFGWRYVFKVWYTGGTYTYIVGAEDAVDRNTLINQFPSGNVYFALSASSWFVVADHRTFWISTDTYFGDVEPRDAKSVLLHPWMARSASGDIVSARVEDIRYSRGTAVEEGRWYGGYRYSRVYLVENNPATYVIRGYKRFVYTHANDKGIEFLITGWRCRHTSGLLVCWDEP